MRGSEKCSRSRIAWLKRSPDERLQVAADSDIFAARGKRERERERDRKEAKHVLQRRSSERCQRIVMLDVFLPVSPPVFFFRETLMDLRHVEHMAIRSLMTLMDD